MFREKQIEATRSAAQRRRAEEDAEEDRIEEEARQQRLAEEEAARQVEEARLKVSPAPRCPAKTSQKSCRYLFASYCPAGMQQRLCT